MTTTNFTYKGSGLIWPGIPQIAMLCLLSFGAIKVFSTGAPALAVLMFLFISSFIVIMFNFSFPKSFTLTSEGLAIHTSIGITVDVAWHQIDTIQHTGPNLVIKTSAKHWSAKIINKHMAFIPLLMQGEKFKKELKEHS